MKISLYITVILSIFIVSCDNSDKEEESGILGSSCYPNNTCNAPLVCQQDVCVENGDLCGNGIIEGEEVCDGTALANETCEIQGFDRGTLSCAIDCDSFITDACSDCGNNFIDGNEVCDGTDLSLQTCVTLGFESGDLSCQTDCSGFDVSSCSSLAYGSITIDFATDFVRNNTTLSTDSSGIFTTPFATGYLGDSNIAIPPEESTDIKSYAHSFTDNQGEYIEILQMQKNDETPINPVIISSFYSPFIGVTTVDATSQDSAFYVVDINFSIDEISCIHAVGEGNVSITEVGDFSTNGPFSFSGILKLYHPTNYMGFDISDSLDYPPCPVQ
jgi:hypothetical protein